MSVASLIPLSTCCAAVQLLLTNCEQPHKFRILCHKHNKNINHVYRWTVGLKNWCADRTLRALQSLQKVPVHRAPGSRYPGGNSEPMETTAEVRKSYFSDDKLVRAERPSHTSTNSLWTQVSSGQLAACPVQSALYLHQMKGGESPEGC